MPPDLAPFSPDGTLNMIEDAAGMAESMGAGGGNPAELQAALAGGPMVGDPLADPMTGQQPELGDSLLDTTVLGGMLMHDDARPDASQYAGSFKQSLDTLARMLLDLLMQGPQKRKAMGDTVYNQTVMQLRKLLRGMGEMALTVMGTTDPALATTGSSSVGASAGGA